MACKMIAYYRVSTERQGRSGLGLEGQEAAVAEHVASASCDLIAAYTEVETGTKHDLVNRPELRNAVAHAKRSKAVLVVAKLDRLLRSTVVRAMLKTSGVRFIACDNPHANELTIDILAAVAEDEVRRISERTKAALAAARVRGTALGGARPGHPKPTRAMALKGARASAKARSLAVSDAYTDLVPIVWDLRDRGLSLRKIAAELNASGHATRNGRPWNPMQTSRVLALAPERGASFR
jgi:DNA invertase Pin-like site-specific DNA recombinase